MTRLSVYLATSIDGYIADEHGRLDWLDESVGEGEDYGYDAFVATVDALAMGRGTYDHIAAIDPLPFGDRVVYVFTHRPPPAREGVTFWRESPTGAVRQWRRLGLRRVYVDGGRLISSFLAEGLIDDMLITTAPVVLGKGRPLFHPIDRRGKFRLAHVQEFPSGMINRHYVRVRNPKE